MAWRFQIRLGAYNKANGTNYSITELIKSAEAPNDEDHEKEKSLYKDFYNWYKLDGENGKGDVSTYEKLLGIKYAEIIKSYPDINIDYRSLNYKQIQDLDKCIKDESSEIDITLWK